MLRIVTERAPHLRDRLLEHAISREDVGPDALQQLFFRDDAVVMFGQIAQHPHCPRLERHYRLAAVDQVHVRRDVKRRKVKYCLRRFWHPLPPRLETNRYTPRLSAPQVTKHALMTEQRPLTVRHWGRIGQMLSLMRLI